MMLVVTRERFVFSAEKNIVRLIVIEYLKAAINKGRKTHGEDACRMTSLFSL